VLTVDPDNRVEVVKRRDPRVTHGSSPVSARTADSSGQGDPRYRNIPDHVFLMLTGQASSSDVDEDEEETADETAAS
jgi:hypothetical protein